MHRRLSTAEKGKAAVLAHHPAPRTARVRLSEPDNSALLKKHSLTLIGRVTNPTAQKVWSLIPFFIDHWKTDIAPVGSDLGSGMFQFQFERESDLLTVLEKQPYHYARWMIILERWIPTTSPNFPSMIPFWIKIQGIPVHLWTDEAAQGIGKDLGTFETAEITALTMRIRVHINGRLPLIKSTIVEYPNGDEVTAQLVYEKLDKHCEKCCRLDHAVRDCLEAKHEKKALMASHEGALPNKGLDTHHTYQGSRNNYDASRARDSQSRGSDRSRGHARPAHRHADRPSVRGVGSVPSQRNRAGSRQEWQPRDRYHSNPPRRNEERYSRNSEDQCHDNFRNFRGESHSAISPRIGWQRQSADNDNLNTPPPRQEDDFRMEQAAARDNPHIGHKETPLGTRQINLSRDKSTVAVEEVRGAILQYANCTDPAESAARRERLIQAEAQGQLEANAALVVRTSLGRISTTDPEKESPLKQPLDRVPVSNRLGIPGACASRQSPPLIPSTERVSANSRLGPVISDLDRNTPPNANSNANMRLPILNRLGPQPEANTSPATRAIKDTGTVAKRKPGRPPGPRKIRESPAGVLGTSTRKRKVQQTKPPNVRKKLHVESTRPENSTRGSKSGGEPSRGGIPHDDDATNSDNLPIVNMIPRSSRRRMDFRIHSTPAP